MKSCTGVLKGRLQLSTLVIILLAGAQSGSGLVSKMLAL